ncbi:MAG: FAD:protein FMN transferase [Marmoricola sp.]|nr:FAD:protein FMN transferase [Marmoricola sp.]
MGMPISLALDGRHAGTAAGERAWQDALASLRDADEVFSTYRDDSAVSRLARGELSPAECPAEVAAVLDLAEVARVESDGAFDVRRPGPGGHLVLDPSGIVKGWAVDRAARALRALDETDFCLSAGGDLLCVTTRAEAPDWRIGIEDSRDPARVLAVVPVRNGAVATSGLVHRGAHIVDPRTGATPHDLLSVTVVAADLTIADVDATAAFVLGDRGLAWLTGRPGRSGLVVAADGTVTRFRGP